MLDLSFCTGTGDAADPYTLVMAHETLEACRARSNGPYFVGLIGQHPGPPAIPLTLSKEHYNLLVRLGVAL